MDDSFTFGAPAKTRGRTRSTPEPPPKHAPAGTVRRAGSFERSRLVLGAAALVVLAILAWGFLHFMGSAGDEIASDQQQVVDQIGSAQDVQAQLTGTQAVAAVQLLYAQNGSFGEVTPQSLKAFEPSFSYVSDASTGASVVSVDASPTGVGLAVLSSSGTCLYAHVSASGTTYGSGSTCTGVAALEASSPTWPTAI
jgi:hypothetical protein